MIISESQGESTVDRLTAALEGRYRIEGELGAGGMAATAAGLFGLLFVARKLRG